MLILNFSHPLTEEQVKQVERLTGKKVKGIRQIKVQFDNERPFEEQVEELIKSIGFSSKEWQTEQILIVPPALNFIAVTLLAALHGLMGYFPPIVRLKPTKDSVPPRFEIAEIINLQLLREKFRQKR